VFVHDPTDSGDYVIPIGKQTLRQSHIFYRPCSGIWQSVWIEAAPEDHITQLDINANMDGQGQFWSRTFGSSTNCGLVNVTVHSSSGGQFPVQISFGNSNGSVSNTTYSGTSDTSFIFTVPSPRLWSPDSPTLYNLTVTMGDDQVTSYTGFRTISKGVMDGVVRPLLNGEFIFMFGTLDQGYWPDGLYTPPNREAMVYDLEVLKRLGFNMLRKHVSYSMYLYRVNLTSFLLKIKVETQLFYQACDQMGLLVIQDMPALRPLQYYYLPNCTSETILPDPDQQAEFDRQLDVLVNQHKSFPCIVTWVRGTNPNCSYLRN